MVKTLHIFALLQDVQQKSDCVEIEYILYHKMSSIVDV